MICLKHYLMILTLILTMAMGISFSNDICLTGADYFFKHENYDQAITEYLRYIFFSQRDRIGDQDHEMLSEAFYKMGMCYRNQLAWEKAVQAIIKSLSYTTNDSLRDERKLAIAIIRITSSSYSAAEMELIRLIHFAKTGSIKLKAYFFLGVCYLYQFKWQDAQNQFKKYFANSLNNSSLALDSLLIQAGNLHYKSPNKAKWLSTFIPGAGQLYCGDIKNGINALAINLLTGYLTVDAFVDKRFQDLILGHLAFFLRYYQGNKANAQYLSESYNENLNRETAQKILNYLKINCPGKVK